MICSNCGETTHFTEIEQCPYCDWYFDNEDEEDEESEK